MNVEESIRGVFHRTLFAPFTKAIRTYHLISDGDHIAVCISGGKDSMLMAKLFQELKNHKKARFDLTFLVMDPGYSEENMDMIKSNSSKLDIPVTIFKSDIFDELEQTDKGICYMCARKRRGSLYKKARELGCNKIALGHHYDDVIETILMGMLYGGQVGTMMPKVRSRNYKGMELIRPMYLIKEEDILRWKEYNDLTFLDCACHVTRDRNDMSKRQYVKDLIATLKEDDPSVAANIFRSVENVDIDKVIEYKKAGRRHNFEEDY